MNGCNGKMGRVITNTISKRDDCEIVAGVDITAKQLDKFPVYSSISDVDVKADVIIDFSHPSSLPALLSYCKMHNTPIVLCTTGFNQDEINKIQKAAKETAIFYSGNMSLGINLLIELSKKAASIFANSADIEIIEQHHNQKIDAPSGTALMIADSISSVLEQNPQYVYDRHSYRKPRSKNEIGIHSVRGGTIVGEHEVIFASHDEILKISHQAQSKEIFAVGSINAAIYMVSKKPGLYNMSDLLSSK